MKGASDTQMKPDQHEAYDLLEDSLSDDDEVVVPKSRAATTKPALSRLQRNAMASSSQTAPQDLMDDVLGSIQKLSVSKPASTSAGNIAPRAERAVLAAAVATALPSESEEELIDSSSDSESSESEGDQDDEEGTSEEDDLPAASHKDMGKEPLTRSTLTDVPSIQGTSSTSADLVLQGRDQQPQYVLPAVLYKKLYPHQVEGVKWLWSLFVQKRGGILGDDMGLGKTMQCSAFVAGLLNSKLAKRVLVVAPKTLLLHWENELSVCNLGRRTHRYFGDKETERDVALRTAAGSSGGVLLTTYGMVLHNADKMSVAPRRLHEDSRDFAWDLIILDEGHKVKNPKMKLVQELRKVPAGITVIISGTPIQNNLVELHALFDLCCDGLLGDRASFKTVYERHITAGQDRNATPRQREVGAAVAAQLRRVIAPFFLRREKRDVLQGASEASSSSGGGGGADSKVGQGSAAAGGGTSGAASNTSSGAGAKEGGALTLPHKNDLVVWLRLQPLQRSVYTAFLNSDAVKRALNETDSALAALTVLKKVCDHPALLSEAAAQSMIAGGNRWAMQGQGKGKGRVASEYDDDSSGSSSASEEARVDSPVSELLPALGGDVRTQLMDELHAKGASSSCKTVFVLALLDELAARGHRTLVFSQSRVMLDILQAAVVARNMSYCRIDGSVSSAEDRQAQVKKFQKPGANIPVFLLTSQVGGLGLTLTAADRVVIVDPSWNPAVDNQAVDRAYRIGQTRDVIVYRLITCGTVEEKIYRKQVFKGGLSRTGTEEGVQLRYFTQQQLRDLFTITEEGLERSSTQEQLHTLHASQRKASEEFNQHLTFLESLKGYAGISDHDLLYTSKATDGTTMTAAQGKALVEELEQQAAREGTHGGPRKHPQGANVYSAGAWKSEGDALNVSGLSLGSGGGLGQAGQVARAELVAQQRRVDDLQQRIQSIDSTIKNLAGKMPDGGSKLLKQKEALLDELDVQTAMLNSLTHTDAPPPQQQQGQSSLPVSAGAAKPSTFTSTSQSYGGTYNNSKDWRLFSPVPSHLRLGIASSDNTYSGTGGPASSTQTQAVVAPAPQTLLLTGDADSEEGDEEDDKEGDEEDDEDDEDVAGMVNALSKVKLGGESGGRQLAGGGHNQQTGDAGGAVTPAVSAAGGGGGGGGTPNEPSSSAVSGGSEGARRGLRLAYGAGRRGAAAGVGGASGGVSGGRGGRTVVLEDDDSVVSGTFVSAASSGVNASDDDDDEVTSSVVRTISVSREHKVVAPRAQGGNVVPQPKRTVQAVIDLTSD